MEVEHVRKYYPYIFFALVTLAVMLPLFKPGFILTLDMVFTPHVRLPGQVTSSYLFYAALHVLNFVIPVDVLQKLILASITFLSGIGGYTLVKRAAGHDKEPNPGAYVAGLLYIVNPYTYDRFMAGQFAVLLGYCLLPFVAMQLLALAQRPTWRRSIGFGLLLTVVGVVSIHTLGLVAVLVCVVIASTIWQYRERSARLAYFAVAVMLGIGVFLILSAYWLVPTLAGTNSTAHALAGFTAGDNQAFATLGGNFVGQLLHVIRLQGFWAENTHTFIVPQTALPGWGAAICILWMLVGIGVVVAWKNNQRQTVMVFGAVAIVSAVMATGILNDVLGNIMPLFRGFREPQKFTGLVALAYALFAGWGTGAVLEYLSRKRMFAVQQAALAAVLLLPVLLVPTMFWGFGGQLRPVQYPATWAVINNQLNSDHTTFQTLFLPWHLYMYYRFADRIIMNPAASYFDKPVIASNDPEIGKATPDRPDARKTLLSKYMLPSAPNSVNLGSRLADLHIKYVILDKDNDFRTYTYLNQQKDLRLVNENANLQLYINTAFRG